MLLFNSTFLEIYCKDQLKSGLFVYSVYTVELNQNCFHFIVQGNKIKIDI